MTTTMTKTTTTAMRRGRGRTILREGMHRGMRKGVEQVTVGDYWMVRDALLAIFGSRCKMNRAISGQRIIYPDDAGRVEAVFKAHGITEVWDE